MDERTLWENTHKNQGYSGKIFSLLDSEKVLTKFKVELSKIRIDSSSVRILIPGCGSNANLQICCHEVFGDRAVIDALDWSKEAIDIAKEQTDRLGIDVTYYNQSYYEMSLDKSSYDLIIVSNAIVSQSNENNVKAMANLSSLLKSGGRFTGLFPSPFNMLDYALTNPEAVHWLSSGIVNVEERTINEDGFSSQRFFSPLEMYRLFKQLNLEIDSFEIFFYDDSCFAKQISELYRVSNSPEYCFWGYFINTVKK